MKRLIGTLALIVLSAGCGGDNTGTSGGPCGYEHLGVGATAQFHVDQACPTNPFPSDLMRSGDTITMPGERFAYMLPRSADFDATRAFFQSISSGLDADGFSTVAPIMISLDAEVDPLTVPDGVTLYRFDPAGANPVPDTTTTLVASWSAERQALVLQPLTPLLSRRIYGVVVDADLHDPFGRPTTRSRGFSEFLATAPADITALVAAAGNAGETSDRIALAFAFRTQTTTDDLTLIRDRIFATLGSSLVPAFETPSQIPGLLEGTFLNASPEFISSLEGRDGTNIGKIVNGTFESYDFRGPDLLGWDDALVTGPAAPPTAHLSFRLTIPPGAVPPGGWPIVMFQHGLGGSEADVYEWGNKLALRNTAVIGISALAHGRRPPANVIGFFNWNDMPATRESIRQTNADQLQLYRMMKNAKSDAVADPFDDLDVDDLSYFGISLGGILGSGFISLAPGAPLGLLVVPGGHLSYELYAQEVAANYFWPFIEERTGIGTTNPEFYDLLRGFEILVQTGLDAGDPLNYATHIVTPGNQLPGVSPKRILMLESDGDNWVPNNANESLRNALGIPVVSTAVTNVAGASGTWLYREADFATRYPGLDLVEPHGYFSKFCEAQEQGFQWLESGGTVIIDPLTATPCP